MDLYGLRLYGLYAGIHGFLRRQESQSKGNLKVKKQLYNTYK